MEIQNKRIRTVLFTDMSGFTRNMRTDPEYSFIQKIVTMRNTIRYYLNFHQNEHLRFIGDSAMIIFPTTPVCMEFVMAAFYDLQQNHNIILNGGICRGEIVTCGDDVFGYPINVASKLGEDKAQHGQVLVDKDSLTFNALNFTEEDELIFADISEMIYNK